MKYGVIDHAAHPHQLHLEREPEPYICDGCNEIGCGKRYACKDCDFHLHKDCADPPRSSTHPFYKNCIFYFSDSGGEERYCDACGCDFKGFYYRSDCGRRDLHRSCATLKRTIGMGSDQPSDESDGNSIVKLFLRKKLTSKCIACGEKQLTRRETWGYVSECNKYQFHIYCVKKLILEFWEDAFLGRSGGDGGPDNKLALTPDLRLDLRRKRKGGGGTFSKIRKFAQIVLAVVVAAILGDPVTLIVGVVTSLISHGN